jgi:hypothetical protein
MGGAGHPPQPRPSRSGLNHSCMHWVCVVTTCSVISLKGTLRSITSVAMYGNVAIAVPSTTMS